MTSSSVHDRLITARSRGRRCSRRVEVLLLHELADGRQVDSLLMRCQF